jgi:putative FmdB family regulatory protein
MPGLFALAPLPAMRHFHCPHDFALMPTYEYECLTCGHQFEVVQSMKDPHLTDCPQPGCEGKVRRKIGRGAGIIFKGSGFYQTDYRSDSYKAAAKKDSEGSSTTAAPKESSAPKESGGSSSGGGSTSTPAPPAKTP